MNDARHRRTPAIEHPPAAPAHWATVTRLGTTVPGRGTAQPTRRPPTVDGSLALQSAPTANPPLRVVDGAAGPDDVRAWAARFAQAVVEVLGGDRPLAQLLRWTSQRVYVDLERRLNILARTSDSTRRRRTVRPQVRSVHVCRPTDDTAEVSVHVRHGQRSRALAARLELDGGRWQCTALQLG